MSLFFSLEYMGTLLKKQIARLLAADIHALITLLPVELNVFPFRR